MLIIHQQVEPESPFERLRKEELYFFTRIEIKTRAGIAAKVIDIQNEFIQNKIDRIHQKIKSQSFYEHLVFPGGIRADVMEQKRDQKAAKPALIGKQ